MNTTFGFNKMEFLTGGSGKDSFVFQPGSSVAGTINGGAGQTRSLLFGERPGRIGQSERGHGVADRRYCQHRGVDWGQYRHDAVWAQSDEHLDPDRRGWQSERRPTFTGVSYLWGGSGADTVSGPDGTNAWVVTAFGKGTLNTTLTFDRMENLTGGSGSDTFAFQPGGSVAGTINGGAGTDTLDYSAVALVLSVIPSSGTASLTGGIASIEGLIGSSAGTTLFGPNQTNT